MDKNYGKNNYYKIGAFMIFELNNYEAQIINYDDIGGLINALEKHYDFRVLLDETGYTDKFMIVRFTLSGTNKKFGVGLTMADIGVEPRIVAVPYSDLSLIGYNMTLAILDLKQKTIIFRNEFLTPIVFLKCYSDCFLVLTENCIYLFSYSGEELNMHILDDLLIQFEFTNDTLSFKTDSSPDQKSISLKEFGIR